MITLEMRRRSEPSDDVAALHARLVKGLSHIASEWWGVEAKIRDPDFDTGLESLVDISHGFPGNMRGYVAYVFRDANYTRDLAEFDDRLILEISATGEEYRMTVNQLFPFLVRLFDPYRAAILLDEDLALDDWDAANEKGRRTGRDENGRDGVFRFPPVGYFDRAFCLRAFGFDDQEFAHRLAGAAEQTQALRDGVFFVLTMEALGRTQLIELDQRVRTALSIA